MNNIHAMYALIFLLWYILPYRFYRFSQMHMSQSNTVSKRIGDMYNMDKINNTATFFS